MALNFKCSHCGETVSVRFLKVGELAQCPSCGEKTAVPEDAATGEHIEIEPKKPGGWSMHSTSSTITASTGTPLTGVPRLIRNMLVVGVIQALVLIIFMGTSGGIVDIGGRQILHLGNSVIEIKPKKGIQVINSLGPAQRFWPDNLLFLLMGDPTDSTALGLVTADYFLAGEHKTLKQLANHLAETNANTTLSSEITGNRLEIVTGGEDISGAVYYSYSRIYKAFPYYLRLSAVYANSPGPPAEMLEVVRTVEVSRR